MAVKFILFDVNPSLVRHWQAAFEALVPPEARDNITIVQAQLDDLKTPIDCIVSPANSFGRLDGGYVQRGNPPDSVACTHSTMCLFSKL